MKHLQKISSPIDDVFVYVRQPIGDKRGAFERFFCQEELHAFGFQGSIKQINFSRTEKKGTIRGLHMQSSPSEEIKIVSCLKGEIFDIALDLRPDSETYNQFFCEVLSETNRKTMVIPEGCAHGFQSLSDEVEMLYLHTHEYDPIAECGVFALDDSLNIPWPLDVTIMSERDQLLPKINKKL